MYNLAVSNQQETAVAKIGCVHSSLLFMQRYHTCRTAAWKYTDKDFREWTENLINPSPAEPGYTLPLQKV